MRILKSMSVLMVLTCVLSAHALSVKDIEHASLRNDLDRLNDLRTEVQQQDDAYVTAFLEYRIGVAANVAQESRLAKRSLKRSAKILRGVLKETPDSLPHLTLLAQVYGMQIGVSPMKGMTLGRKQHALIERAVAIDPDNAHALLVKGISDYNTPSMFGGNKSDALGTLDRAIKAFESTPDAEWGVAEAWVWRALTLDAMERRGDAIEALNTALTLEPDYAWARFILASMEATS